MNSALCLLIVGMLLTVPSAHALRIAFIFEDTAQNPIEDLDVDFRCKWADELMSDWMPHEGELDPGEYRFNFGDDIIWWQARFNDEEWTPVSPTANPTAPIDDLIDRLDWEVEEAP